LAVIGWLGDVMRETLVLLYNLTGNHGVAIIILTILIRLVLLPLTLSQTKSMATMRELQPKMKELQEKYNDKPQEYQQKMMQLYKEYNFNPLSGCLPIFVQIPFLWALFAVLRDFPAGIPETNFVRPFSPMFFIWDLSVADQFYVWPILSGVTTYFQMQQTSTDPTQKTMTLFMPFFIVVISLSFPAGLVLYWTVGNVFSIIQQYYMTNRPVMKQGGGATK
jgi:YidC/Oxa1 family membrane protein insertase